MKSALRERGLTMARGGGLITRQTAYLLGLLCLVSCQGPTPVQPPPDRASSAAGAGPSAAVFAADDDEILHGPYFLATAVPLDDSAGDLAEYCRELSHHYFLGGEQLALVQRDLAPLTSRPEAELSLAEVGQLLRLSTWQQELRLRLGHYDQLLAPMNAGIALAKRRGVGPELLSLLYFQRGAARMKLAEAANCPIGDNPYLCLISTGREGGFARRDDMLAAVDDFTTALDIHPTDSGSQWLLNMAHMLLGTYPDGVPERWRIPPERFGAGHDVPRFTNIASAQGMANVDPAGGSLIEDLDNDGLLDVVTSTLDPCRPVTYYHNEGDGRFADHTKAAGLAGQLAAFNIQQTDFNNDGWIDLFFMRGGWQYESGRVRASLLKNNGDGTFADITREAGLTPPAYPTQAAAWADYDNDGDLDLYIGNESDTHGQPYPSQLFRNNGDGTFTDVAQAAGVRNDRMAKGVGWGDYDNDGDPDLYVSNHVDENRLYRNDGKGLFTDVARQLDVTEPVKQSFATWFFDYDNDGWLDIYVSGYQATLEAIARDYLGDASAPGSRPRLFHNDGHGGFDDATQSAGLYQLRLPMGANFGDIDNDGWLDVYLGTGNPLSWSIMPNLMLHNDHGRRYVDVTMSANLGHLPKGHGVAFGDVDNDGDQDIYLQAGGFGIGDAAPNAFFVNPGTTNHWLTVKVVGARSNRLGLGARLKLEVDDGGQPRSIYVEVTGGGSFGASSVQQEVGLGAATRVKSLEVFWPTTGIRQRFEDLAADQSIVIQEGTDAYTVVDRRRLSLIGAPVEKGAAP